MIKVAPSILAADFSAMGREVAAADEAGADWMHLDVMDGHFVPNLTFGPVMVKALRASSRKPFDAHLMISHPTRYIPQFAAAGSDLISWHIECDELPGDVISCLDQFKVKKGVCLKPATPVSDIEGLLSKVDFVVVMSVEPGFGGQKFMSAMMPKVAELKSLRSRLGGDFLIQVDGGVDAGTAPEAIKAGADVLVAGTAVFGKENYKQAIEALKRV